jgi:transcriptional regulator with XRE-family HTH domain
VFEEDKAQWRGLAASFRACRLRQGLSMAVVAERMGANSGMIGKWESGNVYPNAVYFIAWAKALGLWVEVVDDEAGSGA